LLRGQRLDRGTQHKESTKQGEGSAKQNRPGDSHSPHLYGTICEF
jgi:hypothetical protein